MGKRITKPSDDAGGLAVSMKLTSSISRTKAAISNIQNSLSFGEVQDGALQAGARIVDRLAELKTLSLDVMKSSADVANYNTEFRALQQQLHAITTETFNGVSLFATTTTAGGAMTFGTDKHTVSVFTSDRGAAGSVVSLNKSALSAALTFASTTDATNGATGSGITIAAADSSSAIDIGNITVSFFHQGAREYRDPASREWSNDDTTSIRRRPPSVVFGQPGSGEQPNHGCGCSH